jgi:4-amino-4-deoxy-L-arabinose transferase-like glycosyltransferase
VNQLANRHRVALGGLVFVVALTIRVIFVAMSAHDVGLDWFSNNPRDAKGYVQLADNLAHGRPYAAGDGNIRLNALFRPPGYPAILAMFMRMGWFPSGALQAQACAGAIASVLVFALTWKILRRALPALAAGLMTAFSPSGIAAPALFMTELALSVCMVVEAFLLWRTAKRPTVANGLACGIAFALGMLIKPVLWPFLPLALGLLAWMCQARGRRVAWRALVSLAALPLMTWALWSFHNWRAEGEATYSTIGVYTLRYYALRAVEASAAQGRLATPREGLVYGGEKSASEIKAQKNGKAIEYYRKIKRECREIILAHPFYTIDVLWRNGLCAFDGWPFLYDQLPKSPCFRVSCRRWSKLVRLAHGPILMGMFLALTAAIWPAGLNRAERMHYRMATPLLFLIAFYFYATGGMSYLQGSRLVFPVEFAAVMLTVMGWLWAGLAIRAAFAAHRPNRSLARRPPCEQP